MTAGPLAGIRVLDLTSVVVGPTATLTLAQQGADVIKLEAPEGDLLRALGGKGRSPGMSPKFLHFNRGKRTICLDLRRPEGRATVRRIAANSDVLVSNIRPQALVRLGLDHASLAPSCPGLVHCSIVGFGAGGAYDGKPAYDTIIQGASGMAGAMARPFGEPRFMPFVIADHITGFIAAQAITAALLARTRTGRGQAIEVPMLENMASFVLTEHMGQRTFEDNGAMGDPRIMDPHGRPIATADGWICVSANTDAQARGFFAAIGRAELADDPRFVTVAARLTNVGDYFGLRAEALREKPTAHWLRVLAEHDVPALAVNMIEDVMDDAHIASVGLVERVEHPTEGSIRALRAATRFSDGMPTLAEIGRLGADGPAVLGDCGFSAEEIAGLREAGVLKVAA
jgi:crotonobetainyl-CoA:carnitine CoA-transferase CaiB-like acyl-CoA transferase